MDQVYGSTKCCSISERRLSYPLPGDIILCVGKYTVDLELW